MNDRTEKEERLDENNASKVKTTKSSQKCNKNEHITTVGATTSKDVPNTKNEVKPWYQNSNLSSIHINEGRSRLINETTNKMEVCPNILSNIKTETTKQNTFKLPPESETAGSNKERDVVGDDFSRKSEVHILCECEPNVAGAAVPTVQSFIPIDNQNSVIKCSKSNCNLSECNIYNRFQAPIKNKETSKNAFKIEENVKDEKKDEFISRSTNRKGKNLQQPGQCSKSPTEKTRIQAKSCPRKPSLIPKLTRQNAGNSKNLDSSKDIIGRSENINQPQEKQSHKTAHSDVNTKGTISKKNVDNNETPSNTNTITSRMLGLQKRLKATTSMLRQKIEMDKSKENILLDENDTDKSVEQEIDKVIPESSKKTVENLYKSISCLREIASALLEESAFNSQAKYIEKLFSNISEIRLIADKLCSNDSSSSKEEILSDTNSNILLENKKSSKSSAMNPKDNKIYIKFMHAKDKKYENKKKVKELSSPDRSEEVQSDHPLGSKLTSESSDSDVCSAEKNQEDNKIKEADSMDGIFIPSCEPPKNMEDEEETNGLDITITFPEFSQLYSNGTESHLSVCLSDISAEALRKLKRCPKDFTLRMDFVEGKVLFQSGKGPANNFQIGPDLKFCENVIDTKKSDVISIKPSTECSFGSQMIPVDNPKENKSCKSLKSTDSELFNVVNLPFLYKNPYLATSHKSCITFKNDQLISMAVLAKQIFKSMPQIPSLTNIFEDKVMESPSKTDSRKKAEKSTEPKEMDKC